MLPLLYTYGAYRAYKGAFNGLKKAASWIGDVFKHGLNQKDIAAAIDKSGLSGSAQSLLNTFTQEHMTGMQQEQNAWTAQREDTANQRAVADMQAAGLNPALMYGHGTAAASTPAAAPSSGAGISDLISLMTLPLQMKAMSAEIRNVNADTREKTATAVRSESTLGIDMMLKMDQHQLNQVTSRLTKTQADKLLQDLHFAQAFFDVDMDIKKSIVATAIKGLEVSDAQIERWKHENDVSDAQVKEFAAKTNLEENQAWRILQFLPHEVAKMDSEAILNWAKSQEATASIAQAWVALELEREGVNLKRLGLQLEGIKNKQDWYRTLKELGIKQTSALWMIGKDSQELDLANDKIVLTGVLGILNAAASIFGGAIGMMAEQ